MNTDTFTTQDGAQYVVRLRLGWRELQATEDAGFRIFVDGHVLDEVGDISDIPELELRPNRAAQNARRLETRLVSVQLPGGDVQNLKKRDVESLPVQHVAELIPYIAQLEAEEKGEVKDLEPGNPTERKLQES